MRSRLAPHPPRMLVPSRAAERQPPPARDASAGSRCRGGADAGRDGGLDPTSAGTAGHAAPWDGSSAAVGMAANPLGAHHARRHRAGRSAAVLDAGRISWTRFDTGGVKARHVRSSPFACLSKLATNTSDR